MCQKERVLEGRSLEQIRGLNYSGQLKFSCFGMKALEIGRGQRAF